MSRKQSTPNFPKNEHFLTSDTNTCAWISGGKKCSFFGKFGMLCFLVTFVWDSPFCLITNQFIFREELSITSIDSNITDNINLYLVNVPILCPLKTAENTWNLWKKPVSVSTETITWLDISNGGETEQHCVKSVRIRSYSGSHFSPHFPAFGLNTGRYGVSLRIQSKCGKRLNN